MESSEIKDAFDKLKAMLLEDNYLEFIDFLDGTLSCNPFVMWWDGELEKIHIEIRGRLDGSDNAFTVKD
jgi:hypothetical protein